MTNEIVFSAWPKIPRLKREAVITEKIDGTNACVIVRPFNEITDTAYLNAKMVGVDGKAFQVAAQSRSRIIYPGSDNFGFAAWVHENATTLATILGEGYHFGEWWGPGIQRGYDIPHKRFSLFNTGRWKPEYFDGNPLGERLSVVPVLHYGEFSTEAISTQIERLRTLGSVASPGFMRPEGVVVFHSQSRGYHKVLIENDEISKSEAAA